MLPKLLTLSSESSPRQYRLVTRLTTSNSPWKTNDPRGERAVETDPWNSVTSEFTWHSNGTYTYNTTRGNNGNAQANWANDAQIETDPRPYEADLNFNYPLDLSAEDPRTYVNASVTQLFYTANVYHDLLHTLGFNEVSGNFEVSTFFSECVDKPNINFERQTITDKGA